MSSIAGRCRIRPARTSNPTTTFVARPSVAAQNQPDGEKSIETGSVRQQVDAAVTSAAQSAGAYSSLGASIHQAASEAQDRLRTRQQEGASFDPEDPSPEALKAIEQAKVDAEKTYRAQSDKSPPSAAEDAATYACAHAAAASASTATDDASDEPNGPARDMLDQREEDANQVKAGKKPVQDAAAAAKDAAASAVKAALQQAEAAMNKATESLETVHMLPSAHEPHPIVEALKGALKPLAVAAAAAAAVAVLLSPNSFTPAGRAVVAAVGAAAIAGGGYRKRALDASGAVSALIVGFGTLASSFTCGAILLAFFFSSSALTRVAGAVKMKLDAEFKKGGQRDWRQVACNGAVPTVLAVAFAAVTGGGESVIHSSTGQSAATLATALQGAFLGYYACCCGDTWASEVGILSKDNPRLITTLRPVRKGTNGGVSLLGLAASTVGGLFMGVVCYLCAVFSAPPAAAAAVVAAGPEVARWPVIFLGLFGGLMGSVIDSLFGATLQYSGFDAKLQKVVSRPGDGVMKICGRDVLSNNLVNLASASTTALLTGLLSVCMFAA